MPAPLLFTLVVLCFALPWVVLWLLPRRLQNTPRTRAICILVGFLQALVLIEATIPRWHPVRQGWIGLLPVDYGVMVLIPVGAFLAAYYARDGWLFLLYGGVGAMIFIGAYASAYMDVAWRLTHGETSLPRIVGGWLLFTLAAAGVCRGVAQLQAYRQRPQPAFPPRCAQCAYDLRAHAPGQKCPECGTEIPTPATSKLRV